MSQATLFSPQTDEQILKELMAYERHVRGDYDYVIQIEPMPTPRPRTRIMNTRAGQKCDPYVIIYHPTEYTKYKEEIVWKLKDSKLGLKKGDYAMIFVTIHIPYNKTEPQKNRIEGSRHRKKPDWDNYIKGFQDALSDAGFLISGDGAFSDGAVRKRYTTQPTGFISFNLLP